MSLAGRNSKRGVALLIFSDSARCDAGHDLPCPASPRHARRILIARECCGGSIEGEIIQSRLFVQGNSTKFREAHILLHVLL